MKRLNSLTFLSLIVLAASLSGTANGNDIAPSPPAFSTEISIEPTGSGTFLFRAIVRDAASGEALAGPSIKMAAGQTADTESTLPDGGTVNLSATIDGEKRSAAYFLAVKRGDHILSQHSAKIGL